MFSSDDYLDVSSAATESGRLQIVGWSGGWNVNTSSKNLYLNRDSASTSNVLIGRTGYELYVKGDDGNVGIGTTEPAAKLDVKGNLRVIGQLACVGDYIMQAMHANLDNLSRTLDNVAPATLVISGVEGDRIYFGWRDENNHKHWTLLTGQPF